MKYYWVTLIFLSTNFIVNGQRNIQDTIAKPEINEFQMLSKLDKVNDSLFLRKDYHGIILNSQNIYVSGHSERAIVAGYYLLNDIKRSDSVLKEIIGYNKPGFSPFTAMMLFSSSSLPVDYYLDDPKNYKKVVDLILKNYQNKVHATDKIKGKIIMKFIINDQRVRGKYHNIENTIGKRVTDSLAAAEDRANGKEQIAFYRKVGHILSTAEIGEGLSYGQFLLLAHDTNKEHRAYYLKLIQNAVAKGVCSKSRLPDFILRGEMMYQPIKQFLDNLPTREAEMQKEYGLEEYHFNIF